MEPPVLLAPPSMLTAIAATISVSVLNVFWVTMSIADLHAQHNLLALSPTAMPVTLPIAQFVLPAISISLLPVMPNLVLLPLHALNQVNYLMEILVNVILVSLIMELPVLPAHLTV